MMINHQNCMLSDIRDQKPSLSFTYTNHNYCAKYEHPPSKSVMVIGIHVPSSDGNGLKFNNRSQV